MPLQARVGRHARTGAQCQNWVADQQTVIALLNLIPALDGGAEASIAGRVVGGLSSDALYNAILRFQKRYSPARQSGFVDPGDAVLARMELLTLRPSKARAPCPNDFSKSFEIEAREASRTRHQSVNVANRFFSNVGAVGRTGRFISTIIDTKYWFAKLYEITTGFEISAARDYKQPGFVLHFIPIFYDMYNRALDAWPAGGAGFTAMARAFHEYRPSRHRFHNGLVERGDDQPHHRRYRSYPWRYGPGAGDCLQLLRQQILPQSGTAV